VSKSTGRRLSIPAICALAVAAAVAGCASDQPPGEGAPTGTLAGGKTCQETRSELDRLDARGVPARIEAANQGKKLSAAQREEVDHYNNLLQRYLGGRCHLQ
jgi:hypothetical protein